MTQQIPGRPSTSAATQAEMEAASSTAAMVTPGRTQYHPGVAKAWVNFNGTGTVAVRASHNVSSITDNGTGDYTVNFTTSFSSANYVLSGCSNRNDGGGTTIVCPVTLLAGSANFKTLNTGDAAHDPIIALVAFFGDQ